ncbi:hypothetical protein AURDEDRAFT_164971 [Auricularia subglabra TFB-10046 SS5]|nr:hypothetical protein AURDEDRAFT_164971 [Auricularia subglabra TFB-10046 SS5]
MSALLLCSTLTTASAVSPRRQETPLRSHHLAAPALLNSLVGVDRRSLLALCVHRHHDGIVAASHW